MTKSSAGSRAAERSSDPRLSEKPVMGLSSSRMGRANGRGLDQPSRSALPRSPGGKTTEKREKLLDNIEGMLDVLTEDGLSHVLAVATMCRYELALVRCDEARQGDADQAPCLDGKALRIERSADGSTYHLISGKVWKILAAEDIAALLRISRHEESAAAAARRLFDWMTAERKDIAADLCIRGESSSLLREFLGVLTETFPVRSPRRLPY